MQGRPGMSLRARGQHDCEEHHAQRPQRLPLAVPALSGTGLRLGHPGRGVPAAVRTRTRARPRGAMTKARRGQPCLHRHSLDRGGP